MKDLGRPWPKSNRQRAKLLGRGRPRHTLSVTSQARHTTTVLSDDSTAAKAVFLFTPLTTDLFLRKADFRHSVNKKTALPTAVSSPSPSALHGSQ